MKAILTITAIDDGPGMFVSLKSEGDYSGELIDRRFYSIPEEPPAGLAPYLFWGGICSAIGALLGTDE